MCEEVWCKDMVMEILSRLPVKSLLRFMCVSKYFQSLILDPHFMNSRKSINFLLSYFNESRTSCFFVPSPIRSLFEHSTSFYASSLEDSTPFFPIDIMYQSFPQRNKYRVLGSCNGLVCLAICNITGPIILHLWNPATKVVFENLHSMSELPNNINFVMLGYGYDNSRHAYKVVAIVNYLNSNHPFRSLIWNLNDESGWREIQDFPANPTIVEGNGIYLNNTLNWLGLPNYNYNDIDVRDISFDKVVIVSLDLETETYTQMLVPHELNGVIIRDFCFFDEHLHSNEAPLIGVLGGCLSLFLHNHMTKHLSIWQMKEFGNQRSWTLLLNTSFQDLGVNSIQLPPNMFD